MSDPQQLNNEILQYLEKEPNLRRDERAKYLMTLFNKHLEFTKLEHVVNKGDLFEIVNQAKSNFTSQKNSVMISKRQVEAIDLPHLAMIESFISYLNKMNLLKKLVKFDYTE